MDDYQKAALAIQEAHFIMIAAGAGMSADGGVPVFGAIANHKAYQNLGIGYDNLGSPLMLIKNAGLFYGFWLSNLESYTNHQPHEGYAILRQWASRMESNKVISSLLEAESKTILERDNLSLTEKQESVEKEPPHLHFPVISTPPNPPPLPLSKPKSNNGKEKGDKPQTKETKSDSEVTIQTEAQGSSSSGCMFPEISIPSSPSLVVTSNVDGWFLRSGFQASTICEIHGNIYKWQCSGTPNNSEKKTTPQLFLTPPCSSTFDPPCSSTYFVDPETRLAQFTTPPICHKCKSPSRPNIYMFGDGNLFVDDPNTTKLRNYSLWTRGVVSLLNKNPEFKLVIIEIGCGLRVPSIRKRCEELLVSCPSSQATFVRINPDYPDNKILASPNICIKDTALNAINAINKHLSKNEVRG
eukprot:TRINITY_DN4689_c0_g1_i2.p1 TRINITY_DN4689_c0_g1~~TRINITY_DN4689_c0_g1_i2.p1  ORF type:complete len:412 (-),score=64.27 TRINITY_DN4689_c0_g1_i2:127-1362(-)